MCANHSVRSLELLTVKSHIIVNCSDWVVEVGLSGVRVVVAITWISLY